MLGINSSAYNVTAYGTPGGGGDSLATGLVSYWQFNGDATDAQSYANLTAVNSPTYDTGLVFAQAASLASASTQYFINTTGIFSPVTLNGDNLFTAATWVKPASLAATHSPFTFGTNASVFWSRIRITTLGAVIGAFRNGSGTSVTATTSNGAVSVGSWAMLAIRMDGSGVGNVWVNGASAADSTALTGSLGTQVQVFHGQSGSNAEHVDGLMGPSTLWSRYLSDAELVDYYNGGSGRAITV